MCVYYFGLVRSKLFEIIDSGMFCHFMAYFEFYNSYLLELFKMANIWQVLWFEISYVGVWSMRTITMFYLLAHDIRQILSIWFHILRFMVYEEPSRCFHLSMKWDKLRCYLILVDEMRRVWCLFITRQWDEARYDFMSFMMFLVWHRLAASKSLSANEWYGTHVNTFRISIREFVTHSWCLPKRTALRGVSDLVMRRNCLGRC